MRFSHDNYLFNYIYGLVLLLFSLLPDISLHAEEVRKQNLFDWYYAALFGTGVYSVADRNVFMLRIPYERTLRAANEEKYAIMLQVPFVVGFYDFGLEQIPSLEIIDDVATLTVFPGIYYVIPITEQWTLKPFANVGYGQELSAGESAWIYSAGVRSLYEFRAKK